MFTGQYAALQRRCAPFACHTYRVAALIQELETCRGMHDDLCDLKVVLHAEKYQFLGAVHEAAVVGSYL
jgi:hypothetical protein